MNDVEAMRKELQVMRDCCHEMKTANRELITQLNHLSERFSDVADRLDGMISFKVDLARKDAEHDANFEAALSAARRAHERLDAVIANLMRVMWIVLGVVITGVIAGKAFIGG